MAKRAKQAATAAGGETVSGYFRRVFAEQPGLLGSRSNDEILKRWLDDHPGHSDVPNNVKANLQNIKSVLRSKKRRKKAKRAAAPAEAPNAAVMQQRPKPRRKPTSLERLEEEIDDCLTAARALDREALGEIIVHLRRARNLVVWQMGQ
jgi:hypothetical protein